MFHCQRKRFKGWLYVCAVCLFWHSKRCFRLIYTEEHKEPQ